MKRIVVFAFCVYCFCSCRFSNSHFVINQKNIKDVCILMDKHPTLSARFAATEFQFHFKKITGAEIPVIYGDLPEDKIPVCIGESDFTRKLNISASLFDDQEYLIRITSKFIVLAGKDRSDEITERQTDKTIIDYAMATGEEAGLKIELPSPFDQQGTCYAVYDFLERFAGVRWYGPHPKNVVIPQSEKLIFPATEIRRSPVLKYRFGTDIGGTIMMKQYLKATNEMNQLFLRRMRAGGEKWQCNHSFGSYEERFLTRSKEESKLHESYHPEIFAKGPVDGQRQLCYTNQELIALVAQDACNYFDGNPPVGRQVAFGDYFALVPHDNENWCQCDNCRKLLEPDKNNRRGGHFSNGTSTRYIWNFVNEVAKKVKDTHPDKKIAALAYWNYAYFPETLKLEDNISVAPCLHARHYGWATKIKENEMAFYNDWIAESKISNRPVFLWNYYCFPTETGDILNFNVFPGFSAHLLADQIKMYVRDKVRGVFLCGIGEQVDYYLTMKMYDHPELDPDQLLNEFFQTYFGSASEPMKKFYALIEEVYNNPANYPLEISTLDQQYHQTEELAWKYLGTDEVMARLESLITDAQGKAQNELEKERVQSWVDAVWLYMKKGKEQYINKNS